MSLRDLPLEKKMQLLHHSGPKIILSKERLDLYEFISPEQVQRPNPEFEQFYFSKNRFGRWFCDQEVIWLGVLDCSSKPYSFSFKIGFDLDFLLAYNIFEYLFGEYPFRHADPSDFIHCLCRFLQKAKRDVYERIMAGLQSLPYGEQIQSAMAQRKHFYFWDAFDMDDRALILGLDHDF